VGDILELRSTRLWLRRLRPEDAVAIAGYRAMPEVARFQSWETYGPDDAAQLIAEQTGVIPDTPGTWLQLAIVVTGPGVVVGDCGIHFRREEPRQVELGITLSPAYQGQGLAAEALAGVLGYVFDVLHKHRASAVTDAENRSAAALFRRLGFRREAHFVEHTWFKGGWGSEYLFAILAREWQERQEKATHYTSSGQE